MSTLKDFAAQAVFSNLYQTLRNEGLKISSEIITEKVLIRICFCVKPEANMGKLLAACFSSFIFKVGFNGKWYGRDHRMLIANKQALR